MKGVGMNQTKTNRPVKKPANLSVNSELLTEAKQLNINLSATFESALEAEVKARRSAKWLEENKKGLQALNDFVDEHGMFNHKGRMW
jgi:antitoxin CcdA